MENTAGSLCPKCGKIYIETSYYPEWKKDQYAQPIPATLYIHDFKITTIILPMRHITKSCLVVDESPEVEPTFGFLANGAGTTKVHGRRKEIDRTLCGIQIHLDWYGDSDLILEDIECKRCQSILKTSPAAS